MRSIGHMEVLVLDFIGWKILKIIVQIKELDLLTSRVKIS